MLRLNLQLPSTVNITEELNGNIWLMFKEKHVDLKCRSFNKFLHFLSMKIKRHGIVCKQELQGSSTIV